MILLGQRKKKGMAEHYNNQQDRLRHLVSENLTVPSGAKHFSEQRNLPDQSTSKNSCGASTIHHMFPQASDAVPPVWLNANHSPATFAASASDGAQTSNHEIQQASPRVVPGIQRSNSGSQQIGRTRPDSAPDAVVGGGRLAGPRPGLGAAAGAAGPSPLRRAQREPRAPGASEALGSHR